ncbi:NAD-dependent epimerase/dehydratase family protein [Zhihengliuella halotolerans]|uniref:Nucleoside-diphosphate-sugar epimerase n=1 Tax=Zhihengliuella halotolerans TaxID=370736 RepID=A0A4Q8AEC6_9MICC|nr:NAD(P)-dependent oxidoreductase [Zhihengliuella halotolerans]RZU62524.1 nucleoside-diphosphate-sugar epimerase [Zhihengliuella halotolerans]
MARILITGGSGRLGRSVVAGFAAAGHDVVSLDRQPPPDPVDGVAYESVDLLDAEAARLLFARVAPEAVVSLAAIAVPFSAPEDVILKTNAAIAHNVTDAAVEAGVRKVVVASSPSIMGYGSPAGWVPPRLPLDEDVPPQPWHAYGLSKYVAEQVAAMFAAKHGPGDGENGVKFASFRPCYVIAPEEWAGAPTQQGHTVVERLDDPKLSAPALFNYVDARDVTDFLLLLLERMHLIENGDVFFVGAADAMARAPLADVIPEIYPELAHLAGGLVGSSPAFSIEKARRVIGWEPKRSWRTELPN